MARGQTIGRLAAETGVSIDTIRYYEAVGLLPAPPRTASGWRLYPRTEVRRLRVLKQAKLLGLSLAEIKDLLEHAFGGSCAHLRQEFLGRIPVQVAEIDRRIAELRQLRQQLVALQDDLSRRDPGGPSEPAAECEACACIAVPKGGERYDA